MLNSAIQVWQLKIGLMLLQGAQCVVFENYAACLEQTNQTPSLKYTSFPALDATSFLCGSKPNPLYITNGLQKHQACLLLA